MESLTIFYQLTKVYMCMSYALTETGDYFFGDILIILSLICLEEDHGHLGTRRSKNNMINSVMTLTLVHFSTLPFF